MAIEIINGLYLGSKIDSHNPVFLGSRKIKVIINTTTEIPFPKDCENLGIQCIRVPISHENEKNEKNNDEYYYQFRDLCKLIDLKLLQNKNILVHCSSGKTRASTLILVYLMFKLRKLDKNKICYACINNDNGYMNYLLKLVNNKNSTGLPVQQIPSTQNSIAGGFFIIHKDKIGWWANTYNSKLELYFKNNYLVKDDQIILVDCVLSNLNNFLLFRENKPQLDNWFMFQRIFN